MHERTVRRALLSVSDKAGLIPFARGLAEAGIELVSTGGTAGALREAGLDVVDVATVTGAPGILDGRVKTLHPSIHGGILARRDLEAHMATIAALDIPPIDLVVVNLYPFEATVAGDPSYDDAVEMIDIGGPAMIRAAAKNHGSVTVVTAPADYDRVLDAIRDGGEVPFPLRQELAAKAFARTAAYDAAIAGWFARTMEDPMPERLTLTATRTQKLRYGENPHQAAAFYVTDSATGIGAAEQLQGKELSYNNLADADAALELVAEFNEPAVAIIKHANPCGVAIAGGLPEAYEKALACDPVSAYGGIVACNRELDGSIAEHITRLFTEVVIAPSVDAEARRIFETKANLRLLVTGEQRRADAMAVRSISGGLLVQEADRALLDDLELKVVTERAPSREELADLRFAFAVCKHVKSNAIVFAKDGATVGIGAGQMSRLDSVAIAVRKATEMAEAAGSGEPATIGSVVASDAFFPFPDGAEAALAAGATALIQPGGSMRDTDVVASVDRADAAMLFTGRRHFRH
ncbi:MAG: bifunctional phosphoribosylaminoimidazolecarboxamide formyltransferase/IMP cyclohydrolase [Pseudomonadota bacterium]